MQREREKREREREREKRERERGEKREERERERERGEIDRCSTPGQEKRQCEATLTDHLFHFNSSYSTSKGMLIERVPKYVS